MNSRTSQEDRILLLLQAAWPSWVPAARISLQYSRAVFSLRQLGWEIANRVIVRGGVRYGSFRLGPQPLPSNRERRQQKATDALIDPANDGFYRPTKSETKTNAKPNLVEHPDALFGDFSPSRYPD